METALEALARSVERPDSVDITFYVRVERASTQPAELEEAFAVFEAPLPAAEASALRAVAAVVRGGVARRAGLAAYVLQTGFADAAGEALHGIVVVDAETREALWVHTLEAWAP